MADSSGPTPLPNPFLFTSSIYICNSMPESGKDAKKEQVLELTQKRCPRTSATVFYNFCCCCCWSISTLLASAGARISAFYHHLFRWQPPFRTLCCRECRRHLPLVDDPAFTVVLLLPAKLATLLGQSSSLLLASSDIAVPFPVLLLTFQLLAFVVYPGICKHSSSANYPAIVGISGAAGVACYWRLMFRTSHCYYFHCRLLVFPVSHVPAGYIPIGHGGCKGQAVSFDSEGEIVISDNESQSVRAGKQSCQRQQ